MRESYKPLIGTKTYLLAATAILGGKFAAAERMLQIGAKESGAESVKSGYTQLRQAQFDAALKGRNMSAAVAAMQALAKLDPAAPEMGMRLAEARLREGRGDEGKAAFAASIAALPPEKRFEAVARFRQAILAHTKDAAAYAAVQRAYIQLMPPGAPEAKAIEHAKLAYVLYRLGDKPAAIAEFNKLGAVAGSDAGVHRRIGDALSRNLDEPGLAIRFYQRALALKPGDPAATAGLAAARVRLKEFTAHNPGRTPGTGAPPGTATSATPGAKGQAEAARDTGRTGQWSGNAEAAAAEAGRVFDRGVATPKAATPPVVIRPPEKPQPPASERLQRDVVWLAFEKKEKEIAARLEEAEKKADAIAKRLETAGAAEKGKLQKDLVLQRDAATKITGELHKVKVDKESYRVSFEEKPAADAPAKPGGDANKEEAAGPGNGGPEKRQ